MPSTGTPHIEERRIALRRASLGDAVRSAGQDDADGLTCGDERGRRVERQDFAVHRQFAQAPRDELCVLRAEIEDDDGLVRHRNVGSEFTVLYRCRTASPCTVCRVTGARAPSIDALTHRPRLHTHSPAGIADRGVRSCRDDGSRDGARPAAAARARQLWAPSLHRAATRAPPRAQAWMWSIGCRSARRPPRRLRSRPPRRTCRCARDAWSPSTSPPLVFAGPLISPPTSAPATGDGLVFLAQADGLTALDAADGRPRWRLPLARGVSAPRCCGRPAG